MTTMTEREVQKRLVDLSVVTLSALVFGGGFALAAQVDRARRAATPALPEASAASPIASVVDAPAPPAAGLVPAPAPRRRVVVVRRTRAS